MYVCSHLEGAAGMAGLIKTILVLAHGAAPPNLHAAQDVNPRISLAALPAVLPAPGGLIPLCTGEDTSETSTDSPTESKQPDESTCTKSRGLLAGVSSFGFGGTNAHVVLEADPDVSGRDDVPEAKADPTPGVAFLFTGQGSQVSTRLRGAIFSCMI